MNINRYLKSGVAVAPIAFPAAKAEHLGRQKVAADAVCTIMGDRGVNIPADATTEERVSFARNTTQRVLKR